MPYTCDVTSIAGRAIVIQVTPEQRDAEPFYTGADFAVAMLVGHGPSALAALLGDDPVERIARGGFDPSPYVTSVDVRMIRRAKRYSGPAPVAEYTIAVTNVAWLSHRKRGESYDSYAYSDEGP